MLEPYRVPVSIQPVTMTAPNVTIYFPRVTGLQDKIVQEKINRTILNQVDALINEQGYFEHPTKTEMLGNFEIKTNERGILSLTLSNYAYTYPMAHGLTLLKMFPVSVYDLEDIINEQGPLGKMLPNQ